MANCSHFKVLFNPLISTQVVCVEVTRSLNINWNCNHKEPKISISKGRKNKKLRIKQRYTYTLSATIPSELIHSTSLIWYPSGCIKCLCRFPLYCRHRRHGPTLYKYFSSLLAHSCARHGSISDKGGQGAPLCCGGDRTCLVRVRFSIKHDTQVLQGPNSETMQFCGHKNSHGFSVSGFASKYSHTSSSNWSIESKIWHWTTRLMTPSAVVPRHGSSNRLCSHSPQFVIFHATMFLCSSQILKHGFFVAGFGILRQGKSNVS
jgi:hypothetical protein